MCARFSQSSMFNGCLNLFVWCSMRNILIFTIFSAFLAMPAMAAKRNDGGAKQDKNKAVKTFGADKYNPAPGKPFRKTK